MPFETINPALKNLQDCIQFLYVKGVPEFRIQNH